jgi:hypothetical protein
MPDETPTDTPAPDAPETPPPPTPPEPAEDTDTEQLGESGKKALDEERKARRDAERRLRKAEADLEEAHRQTMSDEERKLDEARAQGRKEATDGVMAKLFAAEVKAAASGKVANPNLLTKPNTALELLGLDEIPTTSEGDIDSAAIADAIDRLLETEPYLAATNGAMPKPAGDTGQGPRGQTGPSQLTQADLDHMSPDQIVEAKNAGRFDDLLGIKR